MNRSLVDLKQNRTNVTFVTSMKVQFSFFVVEFDKLLDVRVAKSKQNCICLDQAKLSHKIQKIRLASMFFWIWTQSDVVGKTSPLTFACIRVGSHLGTLAALCGH